MASSSRRLHVSRTFAMRWIPSESCDEDITSEPSDLPRASPTAVLSPKHPPLYLPRALCCKCSHSKLCCCSLVCFIALSLCLHPLSPFSVVCGAPSGESKTHQESTAFCRLFEPTRSAARAAGQRAPAAHQVQVCLRSPPSVVRLLSQGQYE